MRILVVGGTLFIGRHLVDALVKGGYDVTVLHRNPKHVLPKRVHGLIADRNDAASLAPALAGKQFDAVFDNVYDWQRGTTAAQVEATARACGGSLERYIFMSSVAAYGDGLNHHEGDALAPDNHPDAYARNKATSERALFRMHQRDGFPVVTLRPPFVYGPENPFYRESFFWDRLRDNRMIVLPGDGRRLMQFVYVKDLVVSCLRILEESSTVGHAFNIADAHAVTQLQAVEAIAKTAGKRPKLVSLPREMVQRAGGAVTGAKLYFGELYDLPPITMIIQKAQRMLKFRPTDFQTGLKETYRWWLRHGSDRKPDYGFEDQLIALFRPGVEARA
jgi:nucleoside-diphosphate-sugar epimerase